MPFFSIYSYLTPMHGYLTLSRPRLFGARLHVHWSAVLVAGMMIGAAGRDRLEGLLMAMCYFGILVLHEAGHAYVARRQRLRPQNVHIGILHGQCDFDLPYSEKDHVILAWAGVLAQLSLALPVILLDRLTAVSSLPYAGLMVSILGYANLFWALFNLVPVAPLDGRVAWRIVAVLREESGLRSRAKKAANDLMRRLK
jgi:Zn-dependent protease